ncbi:transglycosylase domain-containing protein [Microlunatus soli]|uniref:Membrane carboxypeptidase (Penicillin-binding protein) n=1 Tax=Microlunatus soli TaxID=630515 RepID=A0A1H1T2I0_9ACTN|nr:transglycosylase domain-containing protein [Microlunatus soli]SDS54371.1 Membrane carboxypeptidase (penicillin-binding protein) [Microlunatus soli]
MFLVVSMVAGLLVAGLAVPVAAMAGVGGRAAQKTVEDLPQALETPPQPVKSKVTMANGKVLAYFYDQDRTYVKLKDIAPVMRKAQLAIEDHRFYEHGALDVQGTLRALLSNTASGDVTGGGSSITQQYVKMVRIQQAELAGNEKGIQDAQTASGAAGYARKIQELKYAIGLEKKLSKDQILERYLNIAYYGDGAYGVEAAARHYFSKSADELDLPEAAMLAGLVQSPDNDPVRHEEQAINRRNFVLSRMSEVGSITSKQLAEAKKATFDESEVKRTPNGCLSAQYPFLCDYVYKSLLKLPSLGKTPQARENAIKRGGLDIETAIDPKTQDAAQKAVTKYVDPKEPIISTMSMIQPGTGLIVGMAQNRYKMGDNAKKGETYYDYPATSDLGGSSGGFQSGSTFKAITIAAALEEGVSPSKTYNAQPRMQFGNGKVWKGCDGAFPLGGSYNAKNSTGVNGVMDMRRAAKGSVNTYFLQLERTIGICKVAKMADRLGVKMANGQDLVKTYGAIPSLTLGVVDLAPLSLAEAYATFAARGIHCDPIIIDKITNADGKKIDPPSGNCKRVISKDVADGVNSILQGVMEGNGTGVPARIPDGRPQAGKTGTTNDNQAVWFAGYTPDLAGVASIAEDVTMKPFLKDKKHDRRPGGLEGYYMKHSDRTLQGSGGGDAGSGIWSPAMTKALKGVEPSKFGNYKNSDTAGSKNVAVPDVSGMGLTKGQEKLEEAGFSVVNTTRYSDYAQGSFIGFSQYGGELPKFSTIYAVFSAGPAPKPKVTKKQKSGGSDSSDNDTSKKKKKKSDDGDGGKKKKSDDGGKKKKKKNN